MKNGVLIVPLDQYRRDMHLGSLVDHIRKVHPGYEWAILTDPPLIPSIVHIDCEVKPAGLPAGLAWAVRHGDTEMCKACGETIPKLYCFAAKLACP